MSLESDNPPADGSIIDPGRQDPYTLDEVWCLSGNCRLFADISERMKQSLESEDFAMFMVLLDLWKRASQKFAKVLCQRRFIATVEMMKDEFAECSSFPWFCLELIALHRRWTLFAVRSKLNKIDWPCSSSRMLKRVDPFFDGHEVEYRNFQMNGARLQDAIKALDSFRENRRSVPVAIEATTNGRAPEASADRHDLAAPEAQAELPELGPQQGRAAVPSKNGRATEGNGTVATGETPLAGSGRDIEAPQATVIAPGKRTTNPSSPSREGPPEADADVWISFDVAHDQTGLEPYQITRACDSEKVRSKGKGRGRLVHSADIGRFVSARAKNRR